MKKMLRLCGAILGLIVAACSNVVDTSAAESKVTVFHQMLDGDLGAEIYSHASTDLQKAASEKDFVALISAVHRKLGTVVSSEKVGWFVQATTSGTFVTLNYKTVFSKDGAEGMERFVFRTSEGEPLLAGYFINSTALVTR